MTSLEDDGHTNSLNGRMVLRIGLAAFALLSAAGALLWWRFGPIIFIDMLTSLQNCF